MKPRRVDDTLPLPTVPPVLRGPSAATRPPVFVDTTGRRAHRLRRWAWLVAVPAAAYLVAVAISLLGGPSLPSALLLIDKPSHSSTPQDDSVSRTGRDVGSAPAVSPDMRTESVTRPDDTTDAATGRMASRQPGSEDSRSQTGTSTWSGRSGDTPAADRRVARGWPTHAGQRRTGRGSTGQNEGDSASQVGGERLPDERVPAASRLR